MSRSSATVIDTSRVIAGRLETGRYNERSRIWATTRGSTARQQADVGNAFAQHQNAVEAEAHRKTARVAVVAHVEDVARGQTAFADLDPLVAVQDVDLQAVGCVRMHARFHAPFGTGQRRPHDDFDHVFQVADSERCFVGDTPDVELMRRTGVQPVDGVTAIDDARARDQPGAIEQAQRGRDERRRMAAQHRRVGDIARVAGVARYRGGVVSEGVVIVGDVDNAGAAIDDNLAAPRFAQRADDVVDDELDCVRSFAGIGEVAPRERAGDSFGRKMSGHERSFRCNRRGVMPPGRKRRARNERRLRERACPPAPSRGPGAAKSPLTRVRHNAHITGASFTIAER